MLFVCSRIRLDFTSSGTETGFPTRSRLSLVKSGFTAATCDSGGASAPEYFQNTIYEIGRFGG